MFEKCFQILLSIHGPNLQYSSTKAVLTIAYRTLGTHGNSFIIKVVAGSILDASLAREVVDSDVLSVEAEDETNVVPSSSVVELFELVDPSSVAASESKADCLVKLYEEEEDEQRIMTSSVFFTCRLARRALLPPSICPCISKHSAPANGGEIGGIRAITFAGFSAMESRPCSRRDLFFISNASSNPPRVN